MLAIGLTLALSAPRAEALPNITLPCAPDAVRSGNLCLDKYEASLWKTTNPSLILLIKMGIVTQAQLIAGGATQLGLAPEDLAAACARLSATTAPLSTPSRSPA